MSFISTLLGFFYQSNGAGTQTRRANEDQQRGNKYRIEKNSKRQGEVRNKLALKIENIYLAEGTKLFGEQDEGTRLKGIHTELHKINLVRSQIKPPILRDFDENTGVNKNNSGSTRSASQKAQGVGKKTRHLRGRVSKRKIRLNPSSSSLSSSSLSSPSSFKSSRMSAISPARKKEESNFANETPSKNAKLELTLEGLLDISFANGNEAAIDHDSYMLKATSTPRLNHEKTNNIISPPANTKVDNKEPTETDRSAEVTPGPLPEEKSLGPRNIPQEETRANGDVSKLKLIDSSTSIADSKVELPLSPKPKQASPRDDNQSKLNLNSINGTIDRNFQYNSFEPAANDENFSTQLSVVSVKGNLGFQYNKVDEEKSQKRTLLAEIMAQKYKNNGFSFHGKFNISFNLDKGYMSSDEASSIDEN